MSDGIYRHSSTLTSVPVMAKSEAPKLRSKDVKLEVLKLEVTKRG